MERVARLRNLIDLAGPGDPDKWGTYVLWDSDPDHPMKVGCRCVRAVACSRFGRPSRGP